MLCCVIVGCNALITQNIIREFGYKMIEEKSLIMLPFDTRTLYYLKLFFLFKDISEVTSSVILK